MILAARHGHQEIFYKLRDSGAKTDLVGMIALPTVASKQHNYTHRMQNSSKLFKERVQTILDNIIKAIKTKNKFMHVSKSYPGRVSLLQITS